MDSLLQILHTLVIALLLYGAFLVGRGKTPEIKEVIKKVKPKGKGSVYTPTEEDEWRLEQQRELDKQVELEQDVYAQYGIKDEQDA